MKSHPTLAWFWFTLTALHLNKEVVFLLFNSSQSFEPLGKA